MTDLRIPWTGSRVENTSDERLRIMRDSSVGALAVVALILLI